VQSIFSTKIINLIESLRILPGVGRKTAQRMAIHLLNKGNTDGAKHIAVTIEQAVNSVDNCEHCYMLTDKKVCDICTSDLRNFRQICVVENMLDLLAIENARIYKGKYFVLNGRISPLDGVGPNHLHLPKLENKVKSVNVEEVILSLSPSIEGETTAHYVYELLSQYKCKISKIGFGVPFGGEIEYLDQQTLLHAFSARTIF
jgi:recombination protein RecR